MKAILATLAALASSSIVILATVAASPASAEAVTVTAEAPPSAHVSFADLDLTSNAGVKTLQGRVRSAAHDLCDEAGVQALDVALARKACFKATYADGLNQVQRIVDEQRLAAVSAGTRTGR